jgi:hypothetical protein
VAILMKPRQHRLNVVLHVKKHRNDTKLVRKEKKKAMNG